MTGYMCPDCGTNIYNAATGWRHYNTGTSTCYDAENELEDLAYLLNAIHDAETADTVEIRSSGEFLWTRHDADADDEQRLGWRVV